MKSPERSELSRPTPAEARPDGARPLLVTHAMVLAAFERAQRTRERSVCAVEAVEELTPAEREAIGTAYPTRSVDLSVHKIVAQLRAKGLLECRGVVGQHSYLTVVALAAAGCADGLPPSERRVRRGDRGRPAHQAVRTALEVSNLALGRPTTVTEIVRALTEDDVALLEAEHPDRAIPVVVAKILQQLLNRSAIASPGLVQRQRFYVAPGALSPSVAAEVPETQSRRRRTLELVNGAVAALGRAVRLVDVEAYAASLVPPPSVSRVLLARDLANLVWTGDLQGVGSVRGGGPDGTSLYLPVGLDATEYAPRTPLTMLETVADAFAACWRHECTLATEEGRRPRPLPTGAVREYLLTSSPYAAQYTDEVSDAQTITNALQALAGRTEAVVRKVRRLDLHRAILWAPADVADDEMDVGDAHASDIERIAEAVRRACHLLNVPAASRRQIQQVVEQDSTLRPVGTTTVANVLQDAAKETLRAGGAAVARVRQLVVHAGRIDGQAYYLAPVAPAGSRAWHHEVNRARGYTQLRNLHDEWRALRASERLAEAGESPLATVALGRALGVAADVARAIAALERVLNTSVADEGERATVLAAKRLRAEMGVALGEATDWAARRRARLSLESTCGAEPAILPVDVDPTIPGWTAEELLPVIADLYPRARSVGRPVELVRLLSKPLRRVPNPEFVDRARGRRQGAEYLFERTAALLYAAKEWGGRECVMQAAFAEAALGEFRDARFVIPALGAPSVRVRLIAVSCLAFVWSDEGTQRLRQVAAADRDGGVRAAALWAYAFSGGSDVPAMLEAAAADPHPRVQDLVARAQSGGTSRWWRL
jgi:hypothetical protein